MRFGLAIAILVAGIPAPFPVSADEACHPISARDIDSQWAHYKSLSGAKSSAGGDKYECLDIESSKQIVCRTTAANLAHPSIVIRTIVQDDEGISIRMEADTGANCTAFLDMMSQFRQLNQNVGKNMQR